MKLYVSFLCLFLTIGGAAKGEELAVRDCLRADFNKRRLMFDEDLMWAQATQRDVDPQVSPLALKALSELKIHFDQYNTELLLALVPRPVLGYPRDSESLRELNEKLDLAASYASITNQLEEIGISAPNLTKIYDYFEAPQLQRMLDHHLTSTGAWAVGAIIASNLMDPPMDLVHQDEFIARIRDLETRETSYKPSAIINSAFTDECLDKIGAISEIDLFNPVRAQSEDALFGDQVTVSPDVILVGTSYSYIADGAIGRALSHFSNKEVKNLAVDAGGVLTSIELALKLFGSEVENASTVVWELTSPHLEVTNLLPVLMVAKATEQAPCTEESDLYQRGDIVLDDDGVGRIPVLGVLENRLELSLPPASRYRFIITLGSSTDKAQRLLFDRNLGFWTGDKPDYTGEFPLWLPGYEWFDEAVTNDFFFQIEFIAPKDYPKSISYRSCFLLPDEPDGVAD